VDGVADTRILLAYLENLERLYESAISSLRWQKVPNGKTHVYLINPDFPSDPRPPYAARDLIGKPYIVLPCRSPHPSIQVAWQNAAVEAIHEGMHTFGMTARPAPRTEDERIIDTPWRYFWHEATSVFMEGHLMPTNPESIRFARNWADAPDRPLDEPIAMYESGMFARYLSRRFGPSFIAQVWHEFKPMETPMEAINRLAADIDSALVQSDYTQLSPIFREYAVESWFVCDHNSPSFAADVYARFGNRALRTSHRPSLGNTVNIEEEIGIRHLSAHYHRVFLPAGCVQVEVSVQKAGTAVRVDTAIVEDELPRNTAKPLAITGSWLPSGRPGERLIVIVSNIGMSASDDASPYSLTVRIH
jgi:hypothetical protein